MCRTRYALFLTEDVRSEAPWTMMFADGVVICDERQDEVEERLERWRKALEDRGMRNSRRKLSTCVWVGKKMRVS